MSTPFTMARLAMASWETIFPRTVLMANGTCSVADYQSMVAEKMKANHLSALALMTGNGIGSMVIPYLRATKANAKKLRKG